MGCPDPHPGNHKAVGFLKNTGMDPTPSPENSQSYLASIQCKSVIDPAIKTLFKWSLAGGPIMVHLFLVWDRFS